MGRPVFLTALCLVLLAVSCCNGQKNNKKGSKLNRRLRQDPTAQCYYDPHAEQTSPCNSKTGKQEITFKLQSGPKSCKGGLTRTQDCLGCHYNPGEYTACENDSRNQTLTVSSNSNKGCPPQKIETDLPCATSDRTRKYRHGPRKCYYQNKPIAGEVCDRATGRQMVSITLVRGQSTCFQTKNRMRDCIGCKFIRQFYSTCQDGEKSKTEQLRADRSEDSCPASRTLVKSCTDDQSSESEEHEEENVAEHVQITDNLPEGTNCVYDDKGTYWSKCRAGTMYKRFYLKEERTNFTCPTFKFATKPCGQNHRRQNKKNNNKNNNNNNNNNNKKGNGGKNKNNNNNNNKKGNGKNNNNNNNNNNKKRPKITRAF